MQATGASNTLTYGDFPTSWASHQADNSIQWLELEYSKPVYATDINMIETYNPGTLIRVDAKDNNNVYHTVWAGTDPGIGVSDRISWSNISFPQTTYPVSAMRLFFETDLVPGWNEIDAVQLVGIPNNPVSQLAYKESASSEATPGPCNGDITGNGVINHEDFVLFANAYNTQQGEARYNAKADMNSNSILNRDDFVLFAAVYGTSCRA